MPSFNSVLRRYTPPTCTLEIVAKSSPLSKWMGKSVFTQLQFQLSFDAPQLPQEKQVTIRGDAAALEDLHSSVTSYVQDFLQRSPAQLNAAYMASDADSTPASSETRAEAIELTTALHSEAIALDSSQTQADSTAPLSAVAESGIYLKPRGLLSHDLFLGKLATAQSGEAIELGTLQLFDLATALDSYAADALALPNLGRSPALHKSPPWLSVAAMALFTVGVGASVVKVLNSPTPDTQVASPSLAQRSQEGLPQASPPSPTPPTTLSSPQGGTALNPVKPSPNSPSGSQSGAGAPPSPLASPPLPPNLPPIGETTPPPMPEVAVGDRPVDSGNSPGARTPATAAPNASARSSDVPRLGSVDDPILDAGDRSNSAIVIPEPNTESQVELQIVPQESDSMPDPTPLPEQPPMPQPQNWDEIDRGVPNIASAPEPDLDPMPAQPSFEESDTALPPSQPQPAIESPAAGSVADEPPPLPNVRLESPSPRRDRENVLREAEGIGDIALKAPPAGVEDEAESEAAGVTLGGSSRSAPMEESAAPTSARPESLFNDPPQLAQAKDYFEERWQPPSGFNFKLEYLLEVNPDGSIDRIVPLGEASKNYIDLTGLPLRGESFVSPLPEGQNLQIRVVLEPDGRVLTFSQD